MKDIQLEQAELYQEFFNFMSEEHGLILLKSDIDEIIKQAKKLDNKLSNNYQSNLKSICHCINWHPPIKMNKGKKSVCSYCKLPRQ